MIPPLASQGGKRLILHHHLSQTLYLSQLSSHCFDSPIVMSPPFSARHSRILDNSPFILISFCLHHTPFTLLLIPPICPCPSDVVPLILLITTLSSYLAGKIRKIMEDSPRPVVFVWIIKTTSTSPTTTAIKSKYSMPKAALSPLSKRESVVPIDALIQCSSAQEEKPIQTALSSLIRAMIESISFTPIAALCTLSHAISLVDCAWIEMAISMPV
jgi:hypothetical protein